MDVGCGEEVGEGLVCMRRGVIYRGASYRGVLAKHGGRVKRLSHNSCWSGVLLPLKTGVVPSSFQINAPQHTTHYPSHPSQSRQHHRRSPGCQPKSYSTWHSATIPHQLTLPLLSLILRCVAPWLKFNGRRGLPPRIRPRRPLRFFSVPLILLRWCRVRLLYVMTHLFGLDDKVVGYVFSLIFGSDKGVFRSGGD